jgi:hypothetical protein
MKTWEVTVPIAGHAYLTVEAESEDEAIAKALDEVRLADIENWDGLRQFNEGNICYCPRPWEIEVTKCYDDEDEEE